ncbi:MAG: hypothetical protein KA314_22955 [Chloroflexi bacterium]|nr:hypothetical protein [Chloroflexota bacterium]MBP8058703.1 hypothetical protein [Chloroflexota bacterium]
MQEIGRVVHCQIQTGPLKQGPQRDRYDPIHLLAVSALRLTERGVWGVSGGELIMDVHHDDYPRSHLQKANKLSFNFTSHYEQMQKQFGSHLWVGCGGDNLVFAAATPVTLADLQGELLLVTAEGQCGRVVHLSVATPCLAFSRFALGHPVDADPAPVKTTLQFLSRGMRGFYGDWSGEPLLVHPGDQLLKG